jgi:hypothetical protein
VLVYPIHGGYQMDCLQCCARLVVSARPLRQQQQALLAAIARALARMPVKPFGRDEILESVRRIPAKPRSVGPKSTTPAPTA